MPQPFASARHSIAECDRCGFRFKLRQLKQLTIKFTQVNIMVCRECCFWAPSRLKTLKPCATPARIEATSLRGSTCSATPATGAASRSGDGRR
jgi:hypothetical protein